MQLKAVAQELEKVYSDLAATESARLQAVRLISPAYKKSALNLLQYLQLRSHDLRMVHDQLSNLGLSGMRSSELYIAQNLIDVRRYVEMELGRSWSPNNDLSLISYRQGKKLLRQHTRDLLGKGAGKLKTHLILNASRKRISKLDRVVSGLKPSIVHFDLMRCGYDNSLEAIAAIKRTMPGVKPPQVICTLQGRRILLDTRTIQVEGSAVRKRRLRLSIGDHLIIDNTASVGQPPHYGNQSQLVQPAVAPTLVRDTPLHVDIGDVVRLDAGKLEAIVLRADGHSMKVVVTSCEGGSSRTLRRYAEVWLPQRRGAVLSPADKRNISQVLEAADIISLAIDHPSRIQSLQEELGEHHSKLSKLLLRVDDPDTVRQLPAVIFSAIQHYQVGLWLDGQRLYSEVKPARLPELQDQIAWIAEAAHLPLIYGTPLLSTMSGVQRPSRSELVEVVDATRAEAVCIDHDKELDLKYAMLLDILQRTEKHYSKRKPQMRALKIAKESLQSIITD